MKKLLIFLSLFIILSITTVEAISFDKTNELNWDFANTAGGTENADTIKVEDGYIYTEWYNKNGTYGVKIIKKSTKGKIIWNQFIRGDCYHNITMIGDSVYYANACGGTFKIDAKTGNTIKEKTDVIGSDIKEINGNLAIIEEEQITIINQELEVLYKLESSKINSSYTYIYFDDYYIENNKIYALVYIDDNATNWVVTLNEKLEIEKKTKITYDDNQGFLSEEEEFRNYLSFVKVGDNFYQIGYDVYKITPSGKTTIIHNSGETNDFGQEKSIYDLIVVDEHLISLEQVYDTDYNIGVVMYTIYDKEFKVISTSKISTIANKPHSWPASISPIENGFIVKWLDEYHSYNSNITEYKQNKAACKIISGTGKNIGDEISCGTENFYIIENDGEKVKALSKYNLYVGKDYYKIDFGQTFTTYNDANNYFNNNYGSEYDDVERFLSNDNGYYGALVYKYIETDKVLQDPKAIGAHGNLKVEPEFPELGVVSDYDGRTWIWLYFELKNNNLISLYNDGYLDLPLDHSTMLDSYWLYVLEDYEQELSKQNINLDDISIISVSELNKIVKNITNKELPLREWYNNPDSWGVVESEHTAGENIYIVGSIKDQMPEGYEWLWGTTYWTRTIDANYTEYQYFVDTAGDLCSIEFCEVSIGAGIRPVITMSVEELEYKIETKTDNKGTIEVKPSSGTGEEVRVTITPKKGYELKEVRVTDAEGNILTFTDYTFIMPSSNVTIEAIFEVKNPNTSATSILIFILLGICAILVMKKSKKRIQWLTN